MILTLNFRIIKIQLQMKCAEIAELGFIFMGKVITLHINSDLKKKHLIMEEFFPTEQSDIQFILSVLLLGRYFFQFVKMHS